MDKVDESPERSVEQLPPASALAPSPWAGASMASICWRSCSALEVNRLERSQVVLVLRAWCCVVVCCCAWWIAMRYIVVF